MQLFRETTARSFIEGKLKGIESSTRALSDDTFRSELSLAYFLKRKEDLHIDFPIIDFDNVTVAYGTKFIETKVAGVTKKGSVSTTDFHIPYTGDFSLLGKQPTTGGGSDPGIVDAVHKTYFLLQIANINNDKEKLQMAYKYFVTQFNKDYEALRIELQDLNKQVDEIIDRVVAERTEEIRVKDDYINSLGFKVRE